MERKIDKLTVLTSVFIFVYAASLIVQSIISRSAPSSLPGNVSVPVSAGVILGYISFGMLIFGGVILLVRKNIKIAFIGIGVFVLYRLVNSVAGLTVLADLYDKFADGAALMMISKIVYIVFLIIFMIYTAALSFLPDNPLGRTWFIPGAVFSVYAAYIIYSAVRTLFEVGERYYIGIASVTEEVVETFTLLEIVLIATTVLALILAFMIPASFARGWKAHLNTTEDMNNEEQNS